MAKRQLTGKRIILTGAASGIGRRLAIRLAQQGCLLVLNARRQARLQAVADEIDSTAGACQIVPGDITDPKIREQLTQVSVDKFGGIDGLINNAGVGAMGTFADAQPDRLRQIFDVNFFALAEMIRIGLPELQRGNDPIIVNIGSVLGHRAAPLKSEYSASKFAVHGFTDALRAELATIPVDVLLVSPSTTQSEFFEAALEDATGKQWIRYSAMTPDYVAAKTVRAMVARKHEIILPLSGKFLVWLDRLWPSLANRLVARFGK